MEQKQPSASELLEENTIDNTHLTELISAAAEEVPDTLISGVWLKINAERKRRRKARFLKYAGIAACLLVVLPMAIRILPLLQNTQTADTATAAEAEIYGDEAAQAETTIAATTVFAGVLFAVRTDETQEETAETAAETTAAPKVKLYGVPLTPQAVTVDDLAETVLRSMTALAVTYDTYAQTAENPSPADFIQKYKISQQDFLSAAQTLGLTFSETELAELWG